MARHPMREIIAGLFMLVGIPAFAPMVQAQAIATLYTPRAEIPKGAYKTWVLFLVNNPEWVLPENGERVKSLYDQFEAFGKAVGPDHLFVWFWSTNIWSDPLYKTVDVIRSAAFGSKLQLLPSKGPYLLITTEYPGRGVVDDPASFFVAQPKNFSSVAFDNASAAEITDLLKKLSDDL